MYDEISKKKKNIKSTPFISQTNSDTTLLMHSSSDDESIVEKPTRLSSTVNSPPSIPSNEDNVTSQTVRDGSIQTVTEPICINETIDLEAKTLARDANRKEKKKRRKNKILSAGLPSEIANDKQLQKYWHKRFSLFSLYDLGVKLDKGRFNLIQLMLVMETNNFHSIHRELVFRDAGKGCCSYGKTMQV